MAAVSALPNGRGLRTGGSVPQEPHTWDYAGRSSQDRRAHLHISKPFSTSSPPTLQQESAFRSSSKQQPNGASKFSHADAQLVSDQRDVSDTIAAPNTALSNDSNYLTPYKNNAGRVPLANISRSGSEADSLLDLYGRPKSTVDSLETREKTPPQPVLPEALYLDEDKESSKWVHRDKLALIESHELQEAGIKLPRHGSLRGRSNSKSKGRRGHSRGHSRQHSVNGEREPTEELSQTREGKRQRMRSPSRQEEEPPYNDMDFDLRTPEEIARDPYDTSSSPMYRQQNLRSSSSRIPLPKSSPMPIPQEHRARHTPIPRTRAASGSWDEEGIAYNKLRPRSQSAGSRILLDDGEPLNSTPTPAANGPKGGTPSTSPSKQRAVSKPVQPNNARKASAALRNVSESTKPRSTSANSRASPATRPKSRSGLEPRPATAINRPEGEAPWLATMYKPDPRLPPDQQLLPTHAKRMQQQQLEQQASAAGLDPRQLRDFSPVVVHTQNRLQPPSPSKAMSPRDVNEKSSVESQPGWPLRVSPKPSALNFNDGGEGGGGTSPGGASDHGGYTTMPKVQTTPPIGSGPIPRPMTRQEPRGQPPREQMQEKGEPKEKGCSCCVLM